MKILIIIDKRGTAIDRLAQAVKKYSPHHKIEILPVHPKRAEPETILKAGRLMEWADIIDVHYWKSGEVIREANPTVFESKPRILFHFNPYDAGKQDVNNRYDSVVVGNSSIHSRIPFAHLVHYGVDLDFFKFNKDYTEEKIVNMSVARIEGKKGVREVAQACKELGYKLKLVGRVSKPDYMREVMKVGEGAIEFLEDVTDEELLEAYYASAIHVCNSVDGFESGTLPILESMACGVPVLTRNIGHVPDIYDGKNIVVRQGQTDDVEDLKKNLKEMMENRDWRLKLREGAFNTVRGYDTRRMVRNINSLYNSLYNADEGLMSVIIPTKDNPKSFVESFIGALSQDFPKYEVVVADSGDTPVREIVEEARNSTDVPIKYIHFPHKGNYTLAEARNRAVIEAEGEFLIFCDDRLKMEPDAVSVFSEAKKVKTWLWGTKDGVGKSFVENFSCVNRRDLIDGGMFNERIQWYGGMTQEIKTRFDRGRGFRFAFISRAKANEVRSSKSKWTKRDSVVEAKWTLYKMYE